MSVLRISTGRSFQIVGPETRKLRQPKRDSTRGTTRSPWSADLRRERAVTVCTGMYTSLKYFGHRPREQSNAISAILKVMRCDIGSQCIVSRSVFGSQICTIIIQIPYCLFESYVHHVATVNIPPEMAAGSVISVKRC